MSLQYFLILLVLILFLIALSAVVFVILLRVASLRYQAKKDAFIAEWEEGFYIYLSGESDANDFINKIKRDKYKYLLDFLKPYFLNLKGDDLVKLSSLIEDTKLFSFLHKKLNSRFKIAVTEAAYFFGLAKTRKVAPLLEDKLKHKDEFVFITVATALSKINSVGSIHYIFNESKRFRELTQDSLYSILTEYKNDICPALIERMEFETKKNKEVIISLFRHFRYYNAGPYILKELVETAEKDVIIDCLKFIYDVEYANAANAVKRFLYHTKADVREAAVLAYAKIAPHGKEDKLIERIYDTEWTVQLNAAEAIWKNTVNGKEILENIAYDLKNQKAASAARMVLSEKTLFEK